MRWHDVPWMDGYTDPLGEVSSPYAGLGIMGPLRLAPGQPPLVGEDLGSTTTTPPPDKPPPAPPPKPGPGPISPGPGPGPGGGGGGGAGGGTTINWITADSGPFQHRDPPELTARFAESQENRPIRRAGFGPPPYGELVPSAIQADANFSTSPLEVGPSSSMSKQGWGDLGANLIARNHYGGYGASEVLVEKRSSAPAAIASVLSTLRNVGKNAGLDTAAAISVREGIPVSEAALEVISTSKLGAEDIKRRIAKLEAAAAVAKAKRQRSRYKKYRVRIAALRARLRDIDKGRVQAVRDVPAIAGDKSRIPPWVTWAGLGLGAASLLVALLSMGKGKKK